MRKASKILGIIGGVIAIIIALYFLVQVTVFRPTTAYFIDRCIPVNETEIPAVLNVLLGVSVLVLIVGILGIVGGVLVEKNRILAGGLLLFCCIISFMTFMAIITCPLFFIASTFAINEGRGLIQQL